MDIRTLQSALARLAEGRADDPLQAPKNIALSLGAEAGILLSLFRGLAEKQGLEDDVSREVAAEALTSILVQVAQLANHVGLDASAGLRARIKGRPSPPLSPPNTVPVIIPRSGEAEGDAEPAVAPDSRKADAAKAEAEQAAAAKLEAQKAEAERIEAERAAEKAKAEKAKAEKAAAEAANAEAARQEAEKAAAEKAKAEKAAAEAAEAAEAAKAEAAKAEAAKAEAAKAEAAKAEAAKAEAAKAEAARIEAGKAAAAKAEAEKAATAKPETHGKGGSRKRGGSGVVAVKVDAAPKGAAASAASVVEVVDLADEEPPESEAAPAQRPAVPSAHEPYHALDTETVLELTKAMSRELDRSTRDDPVLRELRDEIETLRRSLYASNTKKAWIAGSLRSVRGHLEETLSHSFSESLRSDHFIGRIDTLLAD
jgi:DNA repair exonuclease SbcCD ATPase subunit